MESSFNRLNNMNREETELQNFSNTHNEQTAESSNDNAITINNGDDMLNYENQEQNETNMLNNEDTNANNNNNNSLFSRLIPENFRNIATRQVDNIGRRFNILDRVFCTNNDTSNSNGLVGAGTVFDGVFSNLTAKPDNNSTNQGDETRNDRPPTYDEAAADLVPSYYGLDLANSEMYDELCIEGLPVGNMANLVWNIIVSTCFQFIGFLITYMLHTSHAAKQGSRFGLGLTFLSYGYSMIPNDVVSKVGKHKNLHRIEPADPNNYEDLSLNQNQLPQDEFESQLSHGIEDEKQSVPFLAVAIGLLGLFILLKSIIDFIKIKRKERRYLAQTETTLP